MAEVGATGDNGGDGSAAEGIVSWLFIISYSIQIPLPHQTAL